MSVKCVFGQIMVCFHWYLSLLWLLWPKYRDTSSYLDMREDEFRVIKVYNQFSFNKICNVTIIIKSSGIVTSTCHCKSSPWEQQQIELFTLKPLHSAFSVTLYDWHHPLIAYVLEKEVLQDIVIPAVPSVVYSAMLTFETPLFLNLIICLLAYCEISMVGEVKSWII